MAVRPYKDIAVDSLTWKLVREWAADEINRARSELEQVGIPEYQADALRGEIRALKKLEGLPTSEVTPFNAEAPDNYGR